LLIQWQPGETGPAISRSDGSETIAVTMEMTVIASMTMPNFDMNVNWQKSKTIEAPLVVAALPTAAPPMELKANFNRM